MNPRTSITWKPENIEFLRRYSKIINEPVSDIVNELISVAIPDIQRVIDLAEQLRNANMDVKANVASVAEEASDKITPSLRAAYRSYNEMMANIQQAIDVTQGNLPPDSNTGVRL